MWKTHTSSGPKMMAPYEKGQEFGYLEARKIYEEYNGETHPDVYRPTTRDIAQLIVAQDIKGFEIEIPKGSSPEFEKGVDSYVELLKTIVRAVREDAEKEPKIVKVEF